MTVGNGETCYFWSSNWSPFGSISKFLRGESSHNTGIPRSVTLAELWESGSWNLPPARSDAQVSIQSFLSTLQITNDPDRFEWMPDGRISTVYSTSSVYNLLRVKQPQVPWYKEVWISNGIPRHKFLAWLFVLDRCLTKNRMLEWGIDTDPICILCNSGPESRYHLFYSCPYSWEVWNSVACRSGFTSPRDWSAVLTGLNVLRSPAHVRQLTLLAWQASTYYIWAERNSRLHRSRFKTPSAIIKEIDKTIKIKIAAIRLSNPLLASSLFQAWHS
ncbi:hypothetical protein Bca101_068093 [Brassica carinata]